MHICSELIRKEHVAVTSLQNNFSYNKVFFKIYVLQWHRNRLFSVDATNRLSGMIF